MSTNFENGRTILYESVARTVCLNKFVISNHDHLMGWRQYFYCIFETKIVLILKIDVHVYTDNVVNNGIKILILFDGAGDMEVGKVYTKNTLRTFEFRRKGIVF